MDKSTIRILILDDEPLMLRLLSHQLKDLGFVHIVTSDNGLDALAKVAEDFPPDLILLDLNMPEMDGAEFVRRLVEHSFAGCLVLVSGEQERVLHMAERLIRAHNIEVLGHLAKPCSMIGLSAIMERAIAYRIEKPAASRKLYSQAALRDAIRSRQLVNYYQPEVNVRNGELVCVETLVRWLHPQDGLVFPDQFIGVAEEGGLIDELTYEVVRNAFSQLRRWQLGGLRTRLAVNVSMDNLSSIDFAERVSEMAINAGVSPQDVMLEVTESRLMLDQRAPLEVLTRLRMKRFGLAIDDFGTGHSSMSQLRNIPFDELKIDRSFIHGAWKDRTARAIYDASLALGKQLGMLVVAEGVEDLQDWNLLRDTKCDLAQGYFIARPMPPEAMPTWVSSWNARMQHALG
jgi:EAL domain-containing protein (putative c-di-GMP-specific phosphodiesterase class I)/ActR/RegA family two-component response regulator